MGTSRSARLAGLTPGPSPCIAPARALCQNRGAVPTYDYQCRSCGAITEVIHSMLDPGPSACDRCRGELRRVLYPAGIIFKGSGFYRTDSRNGSSVGTGAKSGESTSGETKSGGTAPESGSSTDAKPSSAASPSSSEKPASKD